MIVLCPGCAPVVQELAPRLARGFRLWIERSVDDGLHACDLKTDLDDPWLDLGGEG